MKFSPLFFILLLLLCSCSKEKGQLVYVEANQQQGFNFPYFIFLPNEMPADKERYLIVEPNNSGFASDKFEEHLEQAQRLASNSYYLGNYIAQQLQHPLLVPVFPRPKTDWQIYTHALDRDAMNQHDNELKRLDLQLLAMIDDAQKRLHNLGYTTKEKILMTGFSASGTFGNRFSLLHPEQILAVAAGGLNGLLMLPTDSLQGKVLNYPLGTHDFESRFEKSFNSQAFQSLPQFLFMGELDDNDAIPFADGYDADERDLIHLLLGEEMQPQRWNSCREIYRNHEINATVKTYPEIGHKHPQIVKEEVLEFFRSAIEKAEVRK
ncbi:hypothetical protein [Sunxiuqinia sp. sy24]|uniref:hypothetical protein n=1 Tax=Sunxiuqinia sp. sy24 TaxID=3461495 RepID=UPI00404569CC